MSEEQKDIEIRILPGRNAELYRLVAPLVMDPAVIKQNLGYPFRTSDRFYWFLALDEDEHVLGFIPVETRKTSAIINNYYIGRSDEEVLRALLEAVVDNMSTDFNLLSVTLMHDAQVFGQSGFAPTAVLKKYVKMRWMGGDYSKEVASALANREATDGR